MSMPLVFMEFYFVYKSDASLFQVTGLKYCKVSLVITNHIRFYCIRFLHRVIPSRDTRLDSF